MSPRFNNLRNPLPQPLGLRDLGWLGASVLFGLLVLAAIIFIAPVKARAHNEADWILQGRYTGKGQAANEWCCGEVDCFIVKAHVQGDGSAVVFNDDGVVREIVPREEVQPSADGQFWRCQRPDGSRRCFFAPAAAM
jgi:hypothetical protein